MNKGNGLTPMYFFFFLVAQHETWGLNPAAMFTHVKDKQRLLNRNISIHMHPGIGVFRKYRKREDYNTLNPESKSARKSPA